MVNKLTENTFSNVYRDDYDPDKGFHRILFNNRRALQARELTQLQTIIQSELERFGRNIFKEGAAVSPGGLTVDRRYAFIKLDTSINTLPSNPDTLVGRSFTGQGSGVIVKVLQVLPEDITTGDPATLYVQYTSTINGTSGSTPVRAQPGEVLAEVDGSVNLIVQTTNTTSNPAIGFGTRVFAGAADFFVVGHFVYAPEQQIILSKYSDAINATIGFRVHEEIVTANDDNTLYDNQGTLPNYTAPGADRYRIRLELIDKSNVASNETFVYFAEIINSVVVDQVTGFNQYNLINDLLAVRTKEESGNYTVTPFKINYRASDLGTEYLTLKISDGTAYVNGYRIVKKVPTLIDVEKPTTTDTVTNEAISADYGHYVILEEMFGIPNFNTFDEVVIRNNVDFNGGTTIGTARVRAVEKYLDTYKLYIFDVNMINGYTFQENAKTIGIDTSACAQCGADYGIIKLEGNRAYIREAQNENLFFPLPRSRPKEITNVSLLVAKRFVATVSSNAVTITASAGEVFSNTSEWLFTEPDGTIIADTSGLSFIGAGTGTMSITGVVGNNGDNIEIMAYVFKSNAVIASKTKRTKVRNYSLNVSQGYIDLGEPDIIDVEEIKFGTGSGKDASSYFIVDNGQRDVYYENGRLILKPGKSPSTTNIYVKFTHFEHGAGDFFCVNSYAGIDYSEIPSHKMKNNTVVDLRNVLDFRSTKSDNGDFSTSDAIIRLLPKNTSTIAADVEYYLPRYDKIVLNENGYFQVLQGAPSFNPKFSPTPENCMEIYRVKMNPYTLDENDLTFRMIENKRYTMRDIGKIEKRIDNLEEAISLSFLEIDTKNIDVLDEEGRNRSKAGFFADNFEDQYHTDVENIEYAASIDPQQKIARPGYISRNVGLVYDQSLSTNTILKGDTVYLTYSEVDFLEQPEATSTISVNPYILVNYKGHITLSPASDEWKETEYTAQNIIDNGTVLNTNQAALWNEWSWNWHGIDPNGLEVGQSISQSQELSSQAFTETSGVFRGTRITTGTEVTTQTVVNRVVGSQTIREVVGDRVVDIALIPFMRSKLVYFRAEGLQPNTQVFPFFDGISVANWCRQEDFIRYNDHKGTEWGNTQKNSSGHPSGSTNLYTNARGTVEGSFFIPSTDTLRFRTGTAEFKLLDISVNNERDAVSVARSAFTSSGVLYTRTEDVLSTRVLEIAGTTEVNTNRINVQSWVEREERDGGNERDDPLAQSFFVGEPDGVYITKVALYFSAKGATLPVWVEIRPMVNGYPSSTDIVPGSFKLLNPEQVVTSDDASLATFFEFEEPVYLNSYTEYAVTVLSNDPDYFVYKSKLGEFALNTTERRFGRQSFLGSLFKSQNASTWTAAQEEDLKFKLFRANFTSSEGQAVFKNANIPDRILQTDPIEFFYNDSDYYSVKINHRGHGFVSGDDVTITAIDSDELYSTYIRGTHTVVDVDPTGYTIDLTGSGFTPPVFSDPTTVGGNSVKVTENYMYNVLYPLVDVIQPNSTSITLSSKLHTGKSFAGNETPYVQDGVYTELGNVQNNYFDFPRVITNRFKEADLGRSTALVRATLTTTNPAVSPMVDIQRASLTVVENVIDAPSASVSSVSNIPIEFVAETESTGGSASAKHITKAIRLLNNARGMRIILGAHRPSVCGINMYYKVALDGTPLEDVNWTLIQPDVQMPSDEDPSIFREYRYTPGGDTGNLDDFNILQLKIVFTSTNSSKVPILRDLRVIALGD